MDFSINCPINDVSMGQVSVCLLKEMQEQGLEPAIQPIGNVNLTTASITDEFKAFLDRNIEKGRVSHSRKNPALKVWHLNGGMESFSEKQVLLTFYELDEPTKAEKNVAENHRTIFTSEYSQKIFADHGIETGYVPLGFDSDSFETLDKEYYDDGRIVFNVVGKFERRKNHQYMIESWVKKYGNDPKYFLNCAVFNPFFTREQNEMIWKGVLKNKEYFNVHFNYFFDNNGQYNDFLNSGDIVLGMSGGEGWGLPEFQSVALGKHSVILNVSGYKGWANEENSTLVYPSSKQEIYDGKFFVKGSHFNQGQTFLFDEEDFIEGCEKAIERVNQNKTNEAGLKLQTEFSYKRTVDMLLEELKNV